jgi:putative nucleotidyltransferase with HDIG domain
MKTIFLKIKDGDNNLPTDELLRDCSHLFLSKTSLELFSMIFNMRSIDDSVYAHSLNVALISRTIGRWLKFSKSDLDTLTMAGLLHDIGKLTNNKNNRFRLVEDGGYMAHVEDNANSKMVAICPVCSHTFTKKNPSQVFCSKSCASHVKVHKKVVDPNKLTQVAYYEKKE